MQNRNGGWAAFDRNVDWELLTRVPFADHNAMLDPSCPDITARVLEALGHYGCRVGDPQVDRAVAFLEKTQERHGGWIGRWGVNYIYGSWQVLVGLDSIGYDMQQPMVRRAVNWLKSVQQPCGGWGETCRSYDDPSLAGQGIPTASQTAWAVLGLLAADEADSEAVRCGVHYLINTQQADGSWKENQFTGTGFPKVFYLKYHMYSLYFPLMALARHAAAIGQHVLPVHALQSPVSASRWLIISFQFSVVSRDAKSSERSQCNPSDTILTEKLKTMIREKVMRFPLAMAAGMATYIIRKKLSGQKRFPLVLMLEPLHACNLTCTGCGRIREYAGTVKERLTVDQCLASVDECGAAIVSICGGEPLIYPEIGPLVRSILRRRKHVYLCTNGVFIKKRLHEFKPSGRFFFNVHLDGLEETHDRAVERNGVFKAAARFPFGFYT